MRKLRILLGFTLLLSCSTVLACKYTIREIGFSTLSKVTYTVYKIDSNDAFFPKQLSQSFANANVRTTGVSAVESSHPAVQFVVREKLPFPAYILAAPDGRMIAIPSSGVNDAVLSSPVQKRLLADLPESYAAVLLIEGKDQIKNQIARDKVAKVCIRVTNIMPNMPKIVNVGPEMIAISNADFKQEKVMLWSLGIDKIPDEPLALVVYGKGRIMGEQLNYMQIKGEDDVYKLLSIIGADCECGLDRKWMLGYQMPLDWPKRTRQFLSDELDFDVDNPMVLTEMSRILAIENKVNVDPGGVSFEPVVFDLDEEFEEIPEVTHIPIQKEDESIGANKMILYSLVFFVVVIAMSAFYLMKRNKN